MIKSIQKMLCGYVVGLIILGSAMLIIKIAVPESPVGDMLTALFAIPAIAVIAINSVLFVADFVDGRL